MGLYYALISLSVIMFGVQFLFTDKYQKECGQSALAAHRLTFYSGIVGIVILLIINGFSVEYTHFTLICAIANALVSLLYSICALKALSKINLSLYSLFAMLGGMVLPFIQGLIFYDEPFTIGKGVCFVLITVALALTVNKDTNKGGWLYYVGVFVLNGLAGVVSTFFQKSAYPKTNAESFSIWSAVAAVVISFTALLILRGKGKKPSFKAISIAVVGGTLSRLANYVLVIALAVLPATVQYPFVTGGVMIASTIIAAIVGQKPSKREILSVAISFIGILALVLM